MSYFVDHLRSLFSQLGDIGKLRKYIRADVTEIMRSFEEAIRAAAPVGEVEPFYEKKPSERMGHTPIASGWKFTMEDIDGGFGIRAKNVSEHIKYIIHGTEPHMIVKQGLSRKGGNLYFWWGDYTGSHPGWGPKGSHEGEPGMRKFIWVDHPGMAPNLFVANSTRALVKPTKRVVNSVLSSYISSTMSNFGLGRQK